MGTRRFHFGDLYKQKVYKGKEVPLFEPSGFADLFPKEWLHPKFVEAIEKKDYENKEFLTQHMPGVYSFPCFMTLTCSKNNKNRYLS